MTSGRYDLEARRRLHEQAVRVAEAVVRGEFGVIEGARQLSPLAHELVDDWAADPDFRVFGALDSETDHLPVGDQRRLWDPQALAERDAVVQRIESEARPEVEAACRSVIARFTTA